MLFNGVFFFKIKVFNKLYIKNIEKKNLFPIIFMNKKKNLRIEPDNRIFLVTLKFFAKSLNF